MKVKRLFSFRVYDGCLIEEKSIDCFLKNCLVPYKSIGLHISGSVYILVFYKNESDRPTVQF